MIRFFGYLLLLLIPIVLILIVRLKRRRHIVYTHTFLKPFQDERFRDFLFRTFQLYHDVLFDLLLAVVLSLFLSQVVTFTPQKTAVCIDGSYSMVQGQGETPLARAISLLSREASTGNSPHIFVLAFDPHRGKSRLYGNRDLNKFVSLEQAESSASLERVVNRLADDHTFFNIDLRELQVLYDRGYGRVVFLTDRFPRIDTNLEVVEVGEAQRSFFWPASVSYDFSSGNFQVLLLRMNHNDSITVMVFDDQLGRYRVVPFYEQRLPGSDLTLIEITDQGLYRFLSPGLDYIYRLEKPVITVTVSGRYSRIVLEVLPQVVESGPATGKSEALLADLPYEGQTESRLRRTIRSLGKQRRKLVTLVSQNSAEGVPLIHPLERTLSQPSYAELPQEATALGSESTRVLFQDPLRTLDDLTPVAYLNYLEEDRPPIPARYALTGEVLPGWGASPDHSGLTSFVYARRDELIPVNLSAGEFFPTASHQRLVFSRREFNPVAYFVILLGIYLAKLAFLARFRPISKG